MAMVGYWKQTVSFVVFRCIENMNCINFAEIHKRKYIVWSQLLKWYKLRLTEKI